MSSNNNSLADWLSHLGISKQLNNNDILAGITVNATLAKTIQNYTTKLSSTNNASSRISNWNTIINQLQKLNIHVNQQDKSKILNGDDKIVYNILYEIKQRYDKNRQQVEVDINKIDARGDPKSSKSLLELFILVIIKYYGFSIKEAVALLSNDSKYLAHILAKGFKENPKPVELMILQLEKLLPQITNFCKNKENQTFFLKSIKPGLISKFLPISELSLEILTMFTKNAPQCFELIKTELMPTLILCLRRHGCQLGPIIKSLTEIIGYNKNLLTLFLDNGSADEVALLMIEMINQSEAENQLQEVFQQFKMDEFVNACIENTKNSQLFANSATFLIKLIEHNYPDFAGKSENLAKLVDNLGGLYLSKRGGVIIYSNLLFTFLHLLGKRKNALAPQLFKLALDRYKNALNEDESHNYLYNFLQIIEIFPSIPTNGIAEAILTRYENQTTYIGQLQLDILLNSIQSIDQKMSLRIYNIITKLFVQQVGSVENISNILETIIRKFDTKIIFDLNIKFIKICLAVFYANLRKLNYSKSLIDGTIKLDKSNVFYKAKNKEIQKLLANIILIRDQKLNKALEPLICYSFIQSELKNKDEAEGIRRVMLMLGDEDQLRKLYENDAKLMLEDVKNQGKKNSKQKNENQRYKDNDEQSKIRATSDVTLLLKKKNILEYSLNPPKVYLDAQKGLEKYTKVFLEKVGRQSLEQEKRNQDQLRKQELKKKFTMKILQQGIKISKQITVNCIFQFNTKQKQQLKDLASDFSYLPYYDPSNEEERDIKALEFLMKRYGRLFKVYYNNYGGKLRPNTVKLFEDISERGNLMQSANVWKLLRDHYLDQYITVNEVHFLVQKINAQLKKQYKDSSVLDYEVFQNFIIQAAMAMFSRPPKDMRSHPISEMVHQVLNKLREHAQKNRIDLRLFEDHQNFQSNKSEQIKQLNEKLQQNPDYILPEGYKKQIVKKIHYDYKFYLQSLDESYKIAYELLDEILSLKFEFHIIETYSVTLVQATARPILYQTQYDYSKSRSRSSVLPRQAKEPSQPKDGEQAEENADNSVEASRIQNKFLKQKRQREEERKQRMQNQQKKREERDKQLKALLEKHRQKQQQIEKQNQQKRNQQARRQQQEKKKREKYEQDLKKKVSQFVEKKKMDKSKQEEELKKKRQEENRNMQKMKQDIQRKRKLIDQNKQKKKYDEELKLKQQAEQSKRLQLENKIKLAEKKEKTKKLLQQYKQKRQRQREQEQKLKLSKNSPPNFVVIESALRERLKSSKQAQKQRQKQNKSINKSKEMTVQELDNSDS